MIVLRHDQAELEAAIEQSWANGARNVAGILPTGGGKSIIMSSIIQRKHQMGAVQCVAAHRNELVGQMSLHVARRGMDHRVIASAIAVRQITAAHRKEFGRSYVNPDSNCGVASVQTLNSRAENIKQWAQQVDYFYGDEGHHYTRDNMFGACRAMFINARGALFTASPKRADGKGLGHHHDGIVDTMVIGPDMRTLINIGALCDYEIAIPESDFEIDDNDIAASGDWSTARMRDASKKSHIVGDVVKEYVARAFGKRFICFATDVETSGEIAQKFMAVGIPVASVSAKTPAEMRDEYVRQFRDGKLWGLINVDLFGEGFDVPAVEVVIMARPTASLAVYLQQFGRALRVLPGKVYGLVIDHVSNWKRHGFPDKPHAWSLDRREKRGKSVPDPELLDDLIACRGCSRPFRRIEPACPYCGWEIPLPEPRQRSIAMVDGDLRLLDRETIAAMMGATVLETPAAMAQRIANGPGGHAAGVHHMNLQIERFGAQERLRNAIAQWAGIQRYKGRSDGESYRRFYLATGVDVITAQTLGRAEMEALAVKVEGWCHV